MGLLRKASYCNVSHPSGTQARTGFVKVRELVSLGTGLDVLIGASLGRARQEIRQLVHSLQYLGVTDLFPHSS